MSKQDKRASETLISEAMGKALESGKKFSTGLKRKWGEKGSRMKKLKEGDRVDLSEILFTEDRDFLITNDGQQVRADYLKDKVIVLHFVPLVRCSSLLMLHLTTLIDIYKSLHPTAPFEVVFIGFKLSKAYLGSRIRHSDPQFYFNEMLSIMPWLAIPFSHINNLKFWERRLRYPIREFSTHSFVINPTGVVSQVSADDIFHIFGAEAYPFTDNRIRHIQHQDRLALHSTSITKLLTSHGLEHVITTDNKEVPVKDLEDKAIALYFFEHCHFDDDDLFNKVKDAYDKLDRTMQKNFEIVFVYLHDTRRASESSFQRLLTVPWLALPYKDPRCKNLKRIFDYPGDLEATRQDPRLVIIGPHGKFVEQYGADILKLFGPSACPFTREKAAQLDVESLKNLSLDMFWDRSHSFDSPSGTQVKLSQLAGKNIILVIEDGMPLYCEKFWTRLKRRYRDAKKTAYSFEVIHSPPIDTSYSEYVSTMLWLSSPPFPECSRESELAHRVFRGGSGLLAFDCDGRVVRRTIYPRIEQGSVHFPFFDGNLEKEALEDLIDCLDWD